MNMSFFIAKRSRYGKCRNLRFLPKFEAEPQRSPVSSILCPRFTTAMLTQMSASATA